MSRNPEAPLTLSHPTPGTVAPTGDDLCIEEVVRVARRSAHVEVSGDAVGPAEG